MLFSNLVVICPVALLRNRWNLRLKHLCCNLRLDVVTGFFILNCVLVLYPVHLVFALDVATTKAQNETLLHA